MHMNPFTRVLARRSFSSFGVDLIACRFLDGDGPPTHIAAPLVFSPYDQAQVSDPTVTLLDHQA